MSYGVTVIIPCGGHHARYVNDALRSCLSAVPTPDAIIVADDCSRPEVQIGSELVTGCHLMRFNDHIGRSAARNVAVNKADTPWLFFLDADDLLEPTAILDFESIVGTRRADIVFADYDYLDQSGKRHRVSKLPPPPARVPISKSNLVNIGLFVRRSRFLSIGGFDEDMAFAEYWDLYLRYVSDPKVQIVKADRPFFVARQSSSVARNPQAMMARASAKIQAMIKGGYYSGGRVRR